MAHTFLSYEDLRRTGVLSSEATALQYCLDVELLRPSHFCPDCQTYKELRSCPTTKYSDGYCWSCPGDQHHLSVRAGSVLYNRNITLVNFLHLLWIFVNGTSSHPVNERENSAIPLQGDSTVYGGGSSRQWCHEEDRRTRTHSGDR